MNEVDNLRFKRNLTALVEFSRIINSSLDLNFILNNILLTCMGKFFATRGLIALKEEGELKLKISKGISDELAKKFPSITSSNGSFKENSLFIDFVNEANFHAIEKINSSDECVGVICLGEKLNKSSYSEDDLEFLRTILNISATAVQNSIVLNKLTKLNRKLDSRLNRLNSLFELSKEFGLFSESTKVAKLLVYSIIGQFLISKFAVVSFNDNNIEILESKVPEEKLIQALKKYEYLKIINSLKKDEIKQNYEELSKIGFELIVPMQRQGNTRGLILLGRRINNSDYNESDIEFIYSTGSLAIISLENQKLFKEALEKQKMEEELEIARDIQRNLLPSFIPQFNSFEIAGENISSKQVGGDYYDIIKLNENNFYVAIADVSGKGVPASLLMANIQAFLKIICRQGIKIDEATGIMNDLITENTSDGRFITFFWGIFDEPNKTMTYVNAGHNPPLLIRDNKIIKLDKGGIIFGVMKTFIPYSSEVVKLQGNDVIILFTDGITEAMSKNHEEFSDERLERIVLNLTSKSAEEILKAIKKEVQIYTMGAPQSDDLTLVVIKVK
jgi:sigma-B regulation protein RsbU (phosphoserine phosphatase)